MMMHEIIACRSVLHACRKTIASRELSIATGVACTGAHMQKLGWAGKTRRVRVCHHLMPKTGGRTAGTKVWAEAVF